MSLRPGITSKDLGGGWGLGPGCTWNKALEQRQSSPSQVAKCPPSLSPISQKGVEATVSSICSYMWHPSHNTVGNERLEWRRQGKAAPARAVTGQAHRITAPLPF
ncbi:unnamed protein product [Calypogeia fissa]